MKKNFLIAHGGGPTPVINSSLRGCIEGARSGSCGKIYAARFGINGILEDDLIDLTNLSDKQLELFDVTPASVIGSCRRKLSEADYSTVLETIKKHDIQCLLYNGGNDSMDTCYKLSVLAESSNMELSVIGVPKTIDNDLAVTDHSPGYGSAARFAAVTAAEIGADAAALPIHIVIMELMGRNTGWITAAAQLGVAVSGCEIMTLLPECPFDEATFLAEAERLYKKGMGLLVAVSEGICNKDGTPIGNTGIVDGFGHIVPGGAAHYLSSLIMRETKISSRSEKPGLLGRACMACVSDIDRQEAYAVGFEAARCAIRGETASMIVIAAERSPKYRFNLTTVPLTEVANIEKRFPKEWILPWNIAREFEDYCLPLIGSMPRYAHIR